MPKEGKNTLVSDINPKLKGFKFLGQWGECLLDKREVLSSVPGTCGKLNTVAPSAISAPW